MIRVEQIFFIVDYFLPVVLYMYLELSIEKCGKVLVRFYFLKIEKHAIAYKWQNLILRSCYIRLFNYYVDRYCLQSSESPL